MGDATAALKSITPKKREQLHISGINMLNECGKRFEFRYMLGIRRPPSAYLLVGNATDHSVAANLQNRIDTKELLPRTDAIGAAESYFDNRQKTEPIELEASEKREGKSLETVLGEAKDKTVALAGLHYDQAAPSIQATRVQRKFSINMDKWLRDRAKQMHAEADRQESDYQKKILHGQAKALNSAARTGLDCAGEQDIVEEIPARNIAAPLWSGDGPEALCESTPRKLVIRDTKTSGKSPEKSLMDGSDKPGIADDSDQLTTYAMASYVLDGRLPDLMVLDYLVYTPKRHDTKYVVTKTVRDLNDVNTFLNRFANAVYAYRKGIFVPAKADWWGCSEKFCGYWDMCPYAKKPKLVQITQAVSA